MTEKMREALEDAGKALEMASDAICAYDDHDPAVGAACNLAYRKICAALSTKQGGEGCLSGRDAPSDEHRRAVLEEAAKAAERVRVPAISRRDRDAMDHFNAGRKRAVMAIRALKQEGLVAGADGKGDGKMSDLLPCPFCGRHMEVRARSAFHPVVTISEGQCWLQFAGEHSSPYELDEDDYPAWNRRTPSSIRSQALEEAAKALDIARCVIDADACPTEFNIVQDAFKRIRALSPLPAPDAGWRTIDSAPKDGTHVLVGNAEAQWVCSGYYEAERDTWYEVGSHWTDASDGSLRGVTHWLPLPAPPVGGGSLA